MPTVECDPGEAWRRLETTGVSVSPENTGHKHWHTECGDISAVAYGRKVVVQGSRPTDLLAFIRLKDNRAYAYFDDASRRDSGPATIGWVIVTSGGTIAEDSKRIGETTDNRVEYETPVEALSTAKEYGYDEVDVRGGSQLIIEQARGERNTNDSELKERRVKARELLLVFKYWSLEYVSWEVNDRADSLTNETLDGT